MNNLAIPKTECEGKINIHRKSTNRSTQKLKDKPNFESKGSRIIGKFLANLGKNLAKDLEKEDSKKKLPRIKTPMETDEDNVIKTIEEYDASPTKPDNPFKELFKDLKLKKQETQKSNK